MLRILIILNVFTGLVFSQTSSVIASSSTAPTHLQTWEDLGILPIRLITEFSRICITTAIDDDYPLDESRNYTYLRHPSSSLETLGDAASVIELGFEEIRRIARYTQAYTTAQLFNMNNTLNMFFRNITEVIERDLPNSLRHMNSTAKIVNFHLKNTSMEFEKMANFFNEFLQAIQPASSLPLSTTIAPANQTPLDVDHGIVLSNILSYFHKLRVPWNQMIELASKLASLCDGIIELFNSRRTLFLKMSEIEELTSFLLTLINSYLELSDKMIMPTISSLFDHVGLQNEQMRNIEMLKLTEQSNTNITWVQQYFSQSTANYQMHDKGRNEKYQKLINNFAN